MDAPDCLRHSEELCHYLNAVVVVRHHSLDLLQVSLNDFEAVRDALFRCGLHALTIPHRGTSVKCMNQLLSGLSLSLLFIVGGLLLARRQPVETQRRVLVFSFLIAIMSALVALLPLASTLDLGQFRTFGPAAGPAMPLKNLWLAIARGEDTTKAVSVVHDPTDLPAPLPSRAPETVSIDLTTTEVIAEIAPGVRAGAWTFNGTIPGPFLRVRVGDTVNVRLTNDATSLNDHNIDLHAATGPGGGAVYTNVKPGETKTLTFKTLNPGLYVYHCAHPNVATHDTHGMYGLILVEPEGGLPPVDREFYVMQGEFYTASRLGQRGLQFFDTQAMLDGHPTYVLLNGGVKGAVGTMEAKVGERVRIYFGNGGVNLSSSFHVIGEIFDTVYPEASIGGALFKNVQTTLVPAGGATIVEFQVEVPGTYPLVDHALARIERGAWGALTVTGDDQPAVMHGDVPAATGHGH